jgi:hypothetical protein
MWLTTKRIKRRHENILFVVGLFSPLFQLLKHEVVAKRRKRMPPLIQKAFYHLLYIK